MAINNSSGGGFDEYQQPSKAFNNDPKKFYPQIAQALANKPAAIDGIPIKNSEWEALVFNAVKNMDPALITPQTIIQQATLMGEQKALAKAETWRANADYPDDPEREKKEQEKAEQNDGVGKFIAHMVEAGFTVVAMAAGKFRTRDLQAAYKRAMVAFHNNAKMAGFSVSLAAAVAGSTVNPADKNKDGTLNTFGATANQAITVLTDPNNQFIQDKVNAGDIANAASAADDAMHVHRRGAASAINHKHKMVVNNVVNPNGQPGDLLPGDLNGLKVTTSAGTNAPAIQPALKQAPGIKLRAPTLAGAMSGPTPFGSSGDTTL